MVAVLTPATAHGQLAGLACLVGLLAVLGRVSVMALLRRLLPLLPLLLVPATLPLADAHHGWDTAGGEMATAVMGCTAVILLAITTPEARLLQGLRGLGCPRFLVLALGMMLRYLHVLGAEAQRLQRAAAARGWRARSLVQAGSVGRWVGTLFLRSHARAERVHGAMLARGYTGEPVLAASPSLGMVNSLFTLAVLGSALSLRWVLS